MTTPPPFRKRMLPPFRCGLHRAALCGMGALAALLLLAAGPRARAQQRGTSAGASASNTASPQGKPDAAAIIGEIQRRFAQIRDYSADMTARIDMPGVKVPEMKATIHFKQPDRMKLDAKGFAMLPRDVVLFNPSMLSQENYDMVVQGEEVVDGAPCWKLRLMATSDTLRIQRMLLYVSKATGSIVRMASDPDKGTPADARFTYVTIDGRHELPARIVLRFEPPEQSMMNPMQKPGRKIERGPATIVVTYANYRVNKGIPDSVFKEAAK